MPETSNHPEAKLSHATFIDEFLPERPVDLLRCWRQFQATIDHKRLRVAALPRASSGAASMPQATSDLIAFGNGLRAPEAAVK